MKSISDVNVQLFPPEPVSDDRLQVLRRLDWRFLLANPSLGHVGYIGPRQGPLVDSLRLSIAELTLIEPSIETGTPALHYDVVVARLPSFNALKRAAALVRRDGFIYIEAGWLEALRQLRYRHTCKSNAMYDQLVFPAIYQSALEKLGFSDVRTYWHWPNFDSCTKIIQLADHEAQLQLFTKSREGLRARLKAESSRLILRTGVLNWLPPYFSVVACKQKSE